MPAVLRFVMALALMAAALAGCGGGSDPTAIVRRVADPSPTAGGSPVVSGSPSVPPPTAVAPARTGSPVSSPIASGTPGAAGTPGATVWATYRSPDNKFWIDYPANWTVNVDNQSTFFVSPDQDALAQVTYEDVGVTMTNQQLANIASDTLQEQFSPAYLEQGRQIQPDGSYRIDFILQQQPLIDGQAFVEFQGTTMFLLMFMTPAVRAPLHYPTFERMIASYRTF